MIPQICLITRETEFTIGGLQATQSEGCVHRNDDHFLNLFIASTMQTDVRNRHVTNDPHVCTVNYT